MLLLMKQILQLLEQVHLWFEGVFPRVTLSARHETFMSGSGPFACGRTPLEPTQYSHTALHGRVAKTNVNTRVLHHQ